MTPIKLTARQREVLDLRLAGRTYKEIAEALGIATQTVKPHLRNISRKLGSDSVAREALREADAG